MAARLRDEDCLMKSLLVFLVLLPTLALAQTPPPAASQSVVTAPASTAPSGANFGSPCAYPDAALKAEAQGTALVSFQGSPDGSISDVTILTSSGNADLDKASVQCVGNWRFDPKAPQGAVVIGAQEATILWSIPKWSERGEALPAAGWDLGMPHNCRIYYPPADRQAQIRGSTGLSFTIETDGSLSALTVAHGSGHAELDDAALQCARHWHYKPAANKGVAVAAPWSEQVFWNPPPPMLVNGMGTAHTCPPDEYYTPIAIRMGESGRTTVAFTIDIAGTVKDPRIVATSGYDDLDQASLQCVLTWRYTPAMKDGKPVEVPWKTIIAWSLRSPPSPPPSPPLSPPK
jgi:TonB family protein